MQGEVKWFSNEKKFGFIQAEGKDFFVHFSEIQMPGYKTLDQLDRVDFDPVETSRGWKATNVRKRG